MEEETTNQNEFTTIKISKITREGLAGVGKYGESMADIVARLLHFYEDKRTQQIIDEKSEPAREDAS